MYRFLGVVRTEYGMSIRRWGLWLAFGLALVPYGIALFSSLWAPEPAPATAAELWQNIGRTAYGFNLFTPVVAGIAIADRLARDGRLRVDELLCSTPLGRRSYVLAKYAGALLSILTPVLAVQVLTGAFFIAGGAPLAAVPMAIAAFAAINLPAYAFVTAFSLACPLVMPVRVYQVLFTGYWFWGNFLSPKAFPTLSGTILTPGGVYVLEAFFGSSSSILLPGQTLHTPWEAAANLAVLAGCIVLALTGAERVLAWRARGS